MSGAVGGVEDDGFRARHLRRERIAVGVVFLLTGVMSGTWAARIPAVQEQTGLSPGQLGAALFSLMLGAFAGLPLAGMLVVRIGSRRLLAASALVFAGALALAASSPSLPALAVALTVFGAGNSGVDVAMNTQAVHVEHGYARPILSGLHAMFSAGALIAAGAAAPLAAAGVPVTAHFTAVATLSVLVSMAAVRHLTGETADSGARPRLTLPASRVLMLPGLIAFCMVFAEDVSNSWSAVYLHTVADAGAGVAAVGFGMYSVGMLVGRIGADRIVAARGPVFALRTGGLVACGGVVLAIAVPQPAPAMAGLLLIGLGLAPVLPVLYSVVAEHDRANAGALVAAVTTVGYLGSLAGPGVVGAAAELTGLRVAFTLTLLILLAMTLLAGRLGDRH